MHSQGVPAASAAGTHEDALGAVDDRGHHQPGRAQRRHQVATRGHDLRSHPGGQVGEAGSGPVAHDPDFQAHVATAPGRDQLFQRPHGRRLGVAGGVETVGGHQSHTIAVGEPLARAGPGQGRAQPGDGQSRPQAGQQVGVGIAGAPGHLDAFELAQEPCLVDFVYGLGALDMPAGVAQGLAAPEGQALRVQGGQGLGLGRAHQGPQPGREPLVAHQDVRVVVTPVPAPGHPVERAGRHLHALTLVIAAVAVRPETVGAGQGHPGGGAAGQGLDQLGQAFHPDQGARDGARDHEHTHGGGLVAFGPPPRPHRGRCGQEPVRRRGPPAGLVHGTQALATDVTEHFAHRGRRVGAGRAGHEALQGAGRDGDHARGAAGDIAPESEVASSHCHVAAEGRHGAGRPDKTAGFEDLALKAVEQGHHGADTERPGEQLYEHLLGEDTLVAGGEHRHRRPAGCGRPALVGQP